MPRPGLNRTVRNARRDHARTFLTGTTRRSGFMASLAISVLLVGCDGTTEPQLLPAHVPPTLGVDSIVTGSFRFACGTWIGERPDPAQRVIADLSFVKSPSDTLGDRPSPDHLTDVRATGGRILRELRFTAARADIPAGAVEDLHRSGTLDYALSVPYADRFDYEVAAPFSGDPAQAEAEFTAAGGRVEAVLENVSILTGAIPSDSADAVRALPTFRRIEIVTSRCLAG